MILNNRLHIVKTALKEFAVTIILKSNEKSWQWLYVVPLFHFVAGLSSPYQSIPLDKEIQWNFWSELEGVRKKHLSKRYFLCQRLLNAQTLCSYMDTMITVMDLMEMDHTFTRVMLYMCPHKDLFAVLQKVDPILATSFYIWYIKDTGKELKSPKENGEV